MQVSIKWLHDYIDFTETSDELADKLTMAGIPVENVVHAGEGLEKVVTGKVESIERHPDSDHMFITQMNVGQPELVQIVTGAQNVKQGDIVPVAMIGAKLPNGLKISKGKLRGVPSNGMLCSADELKMDLTTLTDEQKDGIYILPADTEVGIPAKDALGLDDDILEFELTANRGDCFSVFGLVREIAVLTGNTPKWPEIKVNEDDEASTADMIKIGIEANDLCSRFSARVLKNVKVMESPEWMQARLENAGIRAINNIVDVTNFVMVELGQPMHAYDYDQISGHSLTARKAIAGENLHTLDDSSRIAKGEELVIADSEKPAGLAGVMGGLESEVTENTTTVVLEAAAFNGASIRRTSRACGLHSEASGRFERGVDVTQTMRALDRAAQLLQDMGACTVTKGIVDVYPEEKKPVSVDFIPAQINNRLGTDISGDKMVEILDSLGFRCEEDGKGGYHVAVPSWRNDVTFMEDLSEEVARIYGFDNIHASTPRGTMVQGVQSPLQSFIDRIKVTLTHIGMNEELSFSFTNPDMFDKMMLPADSPLRQAIPIMNPLTDEAPLVRTSLLASVLENAIRNLSRKNEDIRLYDVAPVFYPKSLPLTELPDEVVKVAGFMCGRRNPMSWNTSNDMIDFYDAKGIVEELLARLNITRYQVVAGEYTAMHPGKTALFKKGKEIVAAVGELHPQVAENLGISKKAYIFEMDVPTLMKYSSDKFSFDVLPKYPAIVRDLAMLVDEGVNASDIEKTITKNGGKFFKNVTLFDVYTGKQIADGKKSMAFTMLFQSNDKTLTDEEVDESFNNIIAAVEKEFDAELRG
ncbi:phenylalanine--tRNA ligase subunit beta [Anaerovibrio lipolyticus]|uniref:phenylalanine--tRNA ligase subunit beta n=1 Tax=Anaerovibrio lipolyticus TaxID=82374 RepID=UPI0026F3589B|nr:phenylalanine--tRNA ligase subunit beta [Anaerovibrio lipolyticus]MBE6105601.1 phenylalanine--tRNA ligase subunit beta [Anaerovibrio lipolyticus]